MSDMQETLKRVPLENPWAAIVVATALGYTWLSEQVSKVEKTQAEVQVILQEAEARLAKVEARMDDIEVRLRQAEQVSRQARRTRARVSPSWRHDAHTTRGPLIGPTVLAHSGPEARFLLRKGPASTMLANGRSSMSKTSDQEWAQRTIHEALADLRRRVEVLEAERKPTFGEVLRSMAPTQPVEVFDDVPVFEKTVGPQDMLGLGLFSVANVDLGHGGAWHRVPAVVFEHESSGTMAIVSPPTDRLQQRMHVRLASPINEYAYTIPEGVSGGDLAAHLLAKAARDAREAEYVDGTLEPRGVLDVVRVLLPTLLRLYPQPTKGPDKHTIGIVVPYALYDHAEKSFGHAAIVTTPSSEAFLGSRLEAVIFLVASDGKWASDVLSCLRPGALVLRFV